MEILFAFVVGWIIWLIARSGKSSERSASPNVDITVRTGRSRDRHRSHEDAYEDSRRVWVPTGESVQVNGREINDGMVYVGRSLPGLHQYIDSDPALINPGLRSDSQRPDRSGEYLDYWPSYDSIPRSSRAAYLDWLADGRRDPNTPSGYVFLFFYGLERRILVDADVADDARQELPELISEIEALLAVYGKRSFKRYASNLLQYTKLAYNLAGDLDEESEPEEGTVALWKLGQCVAHGTPIPAAWAARFARTAANEHLRTPAERCPKAFYRVFEVRYAEKYGDGLTVQEKSPSLEVSYGTASAGMRKTFTHVAEDTVDVRKIEKVREPLVQLACEVEPEIDDYSRWIGRRQKRDSPAAVGFLPKPIVREFAGPQARKLIDHIENWLGEDGRVVVDSDQVVNLWPTKNDGYMTGKEAEAFSGFLEGFDLGVEPDVRYTRNPSKRDYLTIFRLPDEDRPPGEKFEAARLLLHLAAAVAGADEEISEEEERHIESHLEGALDLSRSERARLRAHLARQLQHPPSLRGVRNRAEELTERQRHMLARFMVTVAGADGHLDHAEIEVLEKVYDTLELDADTVHADLHDMAARVPSDRGPVVVIEADEGDGGHAIPEHDGEEIEARRFADGVDLDMDRLAAVQAETRDVSRELAGVFAEDVQDQQTVEHQVDLGANGLSEDHLALLDLLVERSSCPRTEFDELAEQNGLIPGFALEQINSASLDRCGELLLEGDDPVELNPYALEELHQ